LRLWAINDSWSACEKCTLKWRITQNDSSLESGELPLTLDADSGQMVKEVSVTPTAPGEARIAYWIEDQQGKVVGKNARVEAVTAAP